MKTSTVITIIVVIVILALGGWWIFAYQSGQSANSPAAYAPTTTTGTTSNGVMEVATSSSATLGAYLVAPNGMTLYKYTSDTQNSGVSTCTGGCATVWPPYTISASTSFSSTIAGLGGSLSTITRADGTTQLTYNGWPLYFYSKDNQPGDTNGQNVGGVWFVIAP